MFVFRKIWRALFSWNTRFEIRSFALLPTKYVYILHGNYFSDMLGSTGAISGTCAPYNTLTKESVLLEPI